MIVLKNLLLSVVSILILLFMIEGALRLKNSNMKNYDIEMWKYAKELKRSHPILGHIHLTNKSAILQGVKISLNSYGMRSLEPTKDYKRRILFLGSSITLGWGVNYDETMVAKLQAKFNDLNSSTEVLNGAIGNYNTVRYTELFFEKFTELKPTDIVVHYFINDAEVLPLGGGNWFLRNSQLAVTLWIAYQRVIATGNKGLIDHYDKVYNPQYEGYIKMKKALEKLSKYAKENKINLYLAMSPDIHFLKDYPFKKQHKQMDELAQSLEYKFIDLFPSLEGIPFIEAQAMPGDAHPNSKVHELMANEIFKALEK
ncbi:SGNH/GDSL hydrolase family protein [Sulfurimonas sp.]|uniref:SGNH/GDSL hydrolase family protein n=1 Tax=Sulfurimonas sp. TaxID=2022749 RepID=UPI0035677F7B